MVRGDTLKDQIFNLLKQNCLLKPKALCFLLGLDYDDYKSYVTNKRSEWRNSPKNRLGLNTPTFHHWHGFVYVPKHMRADDGLFAGLAVDVGWVQTKAKNRMLKWKDKKLGHLEWFPSTGRCKIWIKKPANLGKAKQLVANAFIQTGLINDSKHWQPFIDSVTHKGESAVYDAKERLPYLKIDLLSESNGVTVVLGDRSHPTGVELIYKYPDWGERAESAIGSLNVTLKNLGEMLKPKPKLKKDHRMVV